MGGASIGGRVKYKKKSSLKKLMFKLTSASNWVGVEDRAKYYLFGLVVVCGGGVVILMLKLT